MKLRFFAGLSTPEAATLFPTMYLALALISSGGPRPGKVADEDKIQAVEEPRRAIQLAPRFAKAYGQLALILSHDNKAAEAEGSTW